MARTRAIRAALTQAAIRDAQPGAKRRILWDGQTPGLGVLVHPTGHKSFIVQRGVGGRTFKDTLGTFPEMTLAEARRLAEEPLATIRAGRNPNEERREQRVAAERARRERVPCSELWKRYDADVIAVHNTASTAAGKRWRWKVRIEPVIGNVAVRDVDGSHISEIVNAPLRRDKNGLVIKGKGEAGNLYRLLRSLMKKAEKWKLRPLGSDPTKEVEEPKVKRRERLLQDAEITALWRQLDVEDMPWQINGAMRLMLLTGWRIGEVVSLKRNYIHIDRREAHLPDTKTGHSVRPLAKEALALLDSLTRIVGTDYYFPAVKDARKPLLVRTVAKRMVTLCERAGVKNASPHVVRHRIVTDIANSAPNLRTGMLLSGHRNVQAFMTYVHAEREQAAAVAEAVTGKIAALGKVKPAPVMELPASPRERWRRRS